MWPFEELCVAKLAISIFDTSSDFTLRVLSSLRALRILPSNLPVPAVSTYAWQKTYGLSMVLCRFVFWRAREQGWNAWDWFIIESNVVPIFQLLSIMIYMYLKYEKNVTVSGFIKSVHLHRWPGIEEYGGKVEEDRKTIPSFGKGFSVKKK